MPRNPNSTRIRIFPEGGLYEYDVRIPCLDLRRERLLIEADEGVLVNSIGSILRGEESIQDFREYGLWIGPNLDLSEKGKKIIRNYIDTRNKLVMG